MSTKNSKGPPGPPTHYRSNSNLALTIAHVLLVDNNSGLLRFQSHEPNCSKIFFMKLPYLQNSVDLATPIDRWYNYEVSFYKTVINKYFNTLERKVF